MTRLELDSLTVCWGPNRGSVELWNSSGLVGTFADRDQAYAEVLRLRGKPIPATLGDRLAAGADVAGGSEILAARVAG